MGSPASVFNTVTKPVSVIEFKEALEAICRPKFPTAVWGRPRSPSMLSLRTICLLPQTLHIADSSSLNVGLAISGGVDSMALAYLWSKTQKMFPNLKIADYPILAYPHAIIVDHGLRPGSFEESVAVTRQLSLMGFKTMRHTLKWKELREKGLRPQDLPNLESVARILRYQQLAKTCAGHGFAALFTAHHRDDQYETILMRLISGHGYRGIQGMRPANDVPECHGMYRAHKSGFLEDQKSPHPFLNFKPSTRAMRELKLILKDDKMGEEHAFPNAWQLNGDIQFHGHLPDTREPGIPHLTPLECEDGGVTVYRPLLEFDKDRLIATCEANKVTWFEDPTNVDETMTMRNAVRHLVRNYALPEALQKPSILRLSQRAKRRADLEEAEARRLLQREAVIREFDSCVGTLIAAMPTFAPKRRRHNRLYTQARIEAKKSHQRTIAALVIRILIDYVTPLENLPQISNLEPVVHRLFPELDPNRSRSKPVAFSMGGVVFDPVVSQSSVKWFLSRAPYSTRQPLPETTIDWRGQIAKTEENRYARDPNWSGWRHFLTPRFWDRRYWIQIRSPRPVRLHIRPFQPEHAKAFRKALPRDQQRRLEAVLQHYAPGKIRYTLPGVYMTEVDFREYPTSDQLTLLALPTVGIQLPGLHKWLKYEVNYKKVDLSLLGLARRGSRRPLRGYRPSLSQSRRRRKARALRRGTRGPREVEKDSVIAPESTMTWM